MKWAMLAGVMLVSAAAMGQVKLGFINSGSLFEVMPERDSAIVKLEAYAADLQEQLDVMQVELHTKFQEYQKNSTTYSDALRSSKEAELQGISQRIEQDRQLFQQDFNNMQQSLMDPVVEKMRAAIEKVSKENGMTAVFDLAAESMLYHDTATMIDMLPLVKAELGIK